MYDLLTVIKKELWELKHSRKNLLWLLAWLAIPLLVLFANPSRSLVPSELILLLLPTLISFSLCAQIVTESLLGEKKAKTLELLLSTGIPPMTIFFGKLIPAVLLGYLVSQLAILGMLLLPFHPVVGANLFLLSGLPLIVTYLGGCVSALTTTLIADEKLAPILSVVVILVPLVLLANQSLSQLAWGAVTLAALLVSTLLTWLGSVVIVRFPMITKI